MPSFSSGTSSFDVGKNSNTPAEDMDTLMLKNNESDTKTGHVSDSKAASENRVSPNKPCVSKPVTSASETMKTGSHAISDYSGKENNHT